MKTLAHLRHCPDASEVKPRHLRPHYVPGIYAAKDDCCIKQVENPCFRRDEVSKQAEKSLIFLKPKSRQAGPKVVISLFHLLFL